MKILAIESSCDETSAAVIENGTLIKSNVVSSSSTIFEMYGGIVPELAAREQLKYINPVIVNALDQANTSMDDIDSIAVTNGPGLIGSLLVGVETAKTLSFLYRKPIIPVNHVLAHMYANFVHSSEFIVQRNNNNSEPLTMNHEPITFPAISLVASGGHTELFLMTSMKDIKWLGGTLDDAAGEAFDKTARLLGFGSRGGIAIQESATKFEIRNSKFEIKLPRPMLDHKNAMNFSFSGLKTAILREVNKLKESNTFNDQTISHLAHEVQESVTDVLVKKTLRATETYTANTILLSGGVAANLRLREKFTQQLVSCHMSHVIFLVPPVSLCTDNAAYIGSYAYFRGIPSDWHDINAVPDLNVEV